MGSLYCSEDNLHYPACACEIAQADRARNHRAEQDALEEEGHLESLEFWERNQNIIIIEGTDDDELPF
jgi:hypothetical protein